MHFLVKTITLHKAIVGGDKGDPEDLKANPGCVLVNVPKFKVHGITLFTNIIKNLGIGLYPMQFSGSGKCQWDYSLPYLEIPGIKGGIPHQVWIGKVDPKTGYPLRDDTGNYRVEKTGGINAMMIDVIQAAAHQDTFMIHVVDGIEAINVDHQGINLGEKSRDGMVFAALDPVAADLLCARYMFSNVPLEEALKTDLDDGAGGRFPQTVPIPVLEGNSIVSKAGYDCPLSRDTSFEDAEERGLGERRYHVNFLIPVRALSKMVRGKFLQGLQKAFEQGKLIFSGNIAGWRNPATLNRLTRKLRRIQRSGWHWASGTFVPLPT